MSVEQAAVRGRLIEHVRLFGWCSPNDHHHNRCRVEYTGANGVHYRCECSNHDNEATDD